MEFNKKVMRHFDFGLVLNVLLICAMGVVTISSATQAFKEGGTTRYFIMQMVWVLSGLVLLIITIAIDYSTFKMYYKIIYYTNILMLVLVLLVAKEINGARSWLGVGSLGIQPSEFMKISLIILIARKIEEFEGELNNLRNLGIIFLYTALPLALIMKQPDLGTSMVITFTVVGMLFMGGLDLKLIIGGALASAAAVLAVWFSPVPILKPYQKFRILTLFDPQADPLGTGYHMTQSLIAIGSGQLFGMGFGKGLQNEGRFLPESHTDFIFSILGEEFGFAGGIVLIILFASLIFRCLRITRIAKDKFGSMVVVGVLSMIIFQMFQNIGMTIGLMPITGITLPFVSYGGSSMWVSMIGIGLVLNIGMRRHKINF